MIKYKCPKDDTVFICSKCASLMGAEWPEGHCATSHTGKCDECGEIAGLCNVGDWNWPDGKRRGMRD
jgi:hypothetical protein